MIAWIPYILRRAVCVRVLHMSQFREMNSRRAAAETAKVVAGQISNTSQVKVALESRQSFGVRVTRVVGVIDVKSRKAVEGQSGCR